MSDAVSVDDNPVVTDPDQALDDAAPVIELPGQLTFGWGDEPGDSLAKPKKVRKSRKSKQAKPVESKSTGKKGGKAKPSKKPAKTESRAAESQPAKSKPAKKRTANGKVQVSKPVRSAKKKAAGQGTKTRSSALATDEASVIAESVSDATADSSTDQKQTTKSVVPKRTKKKRVPASRKTAAKPTTSEVEATVVTTSEVPTQPALPETKPAAVIKSVPQIKSYANTVDCLPLKWGAKLPSVGFGFWKVDKDQTAQVCYDAIQVGYRHLDCACDYGNEEEVGQGIQRAISDGLVDREDLWVTSKLWNTYHAPEHVRMACEKSLADLQLDYLDLYLIHFPLAQRYVPIETRYPPGWFYDPDVANPVVEEARVSVQETWQALEELTKEGLVRNIGICNFGTSQIRDLLTYAHIRPAVLQVETHPRLTQPKLLRYCQQEKIAYTAFSPLGAQSYYSLNMADASESLLEHSVVKTIAEQVERTAAQVLLRWGVQRGTAVIPKTSSKERMVENIQVFDFELSKDHMRLLDGLDEGRRFNDPGDFGEAAFNTYLPIYE